MKHAGAGALESLSEVLEGLRRRTALVEKRPGIFYVRGKAFLHFHEDRAGIFADLRGHGNWRRFPVNSAAECATLLAAVDDCLSVR
jgi:tRNA-dihydrouridine synthase